MARDAIVGVRSVLLHVADYNRVPSHKYQPTSICGPLSTENATSIVTEWLVRPQTVILTPGEKHWAIFQDLLESGQATWPLVMDAHLAALALEQGLHSPQAIGTSHVLSD